MRISFVPPPLYFAAAFLPGVALDRWLALPLALPHWTPGLAWILLSVSALFAGSTFYVLHSARTTIRPDLPPTVFISSGPFRFTRNPMYLALVFLHLGLALLFRLLWPILLLPFAIWLLQVRIISGEERQLRLRFGDDYALYCRHVRRWI